MRKNISSGTRWEARNAYSRAVRAGRHVWVAGTTAVDAEGRIVGEGDAYAQAAFILRKIEAALQEAGAELADVVRTRIYLVSLEDEEAVGRAHAEFFRDIRPAATMIQIAGLVDPRMRVEIEAEAYVER